MTSPPVIAVVIPCHRVGAAVLDVIARIGPEVDAIFVVDDACPEQTGAVVARDCADPRVRVLTHAQNGGVGAAVMTGYRAALAASARIVVKLDGDGQMDPALIPRFIAPILAGEADYTKGNRFYSLRDARGMPVFRLIGNAGLSILSKLASGYWQLVDPTNGYTAIHADVLAQLPLERIARRYFFESDLLYQLNQARACVIEVPMRAVYGDEASGLNPARMILPFLFGNLYNAGRRVIYSYFVRGFSLASLELLAGGPLLTFGVAFGGWQWWASRNTGVAATAGTVMLAALPVILGTQLLLSWLNFDVAAEPRLAIHPRLSSRRRDLETTTPA
jgi:dolichol-phosphate mannosyltransferase